MNPGFDIVVPLVQRLPVTSVVCLWSMTWLVYTRQCLQEPHVCSTSYEDFGDAVNALSNQVDISSLKLQQVAAEIQEIVSDEKLQQVVAEIPFPAIFGFIPWGHHIEIITKRLGNNYRNACGIRNTQKAIKATQRCTVVLIV